MHQPNISAVAVVLGSGWRAGEEGTGARSEGRACSSSRTTEGITKRRPGQICVLDKSPTVKSCGEGTSSDGVSDGLAGSGGKLPGIKSCFDTFLITQDKFLKLSLLSFTYL